MSADDTIRELRWLVELWREAETHNPFPDYAKGCGRCADDLQEVIDALVRLGEAKRDA